MRTGPRRRRQVGRSTLVLARLFGFRYDEARRAYVLRGVGKRFGPVLRNGPPVDAASAVLNWQPDEPLLERRGTDRRRTILWVEHDRRSGFDRRGAVSV